MLKDITFGQYFDGRSIIHKIDPRLKIAALLLLIIFIFVSSNGFAMAFSALFVGVIIALTRVPVKLYLKNLKAIWPILVFTMIMRLFYDKGGIVIFSFWKIALTTEGLYNAIFLTLRIALLIFVSSVLTYTTTPNDLTEAIERLLSPLKYIGLKNAIHYFAMMMTIALRFIPTLVEEAEKIMNAQKARGADLESGSLKERVKALIPILIPLLLSSVRRAFELAQAMECRCYNGGEGRTRMKQLHMVKRDFVALFVCVLFCCGIIALNIIF